MSVLNFLEAVNSLDEAVLAEVTPKEETELPAVKNEKETRSADRQNRRKTARLRGTAVAACLILLAALAVTSGKAVSAKGYPEENYLELWTESLLQSRWTIICTFIQSSFSIDSNGSYVYPDDYAGMYRDSGVTCLCLKDPDEEAIARYLSLAGNAARYIRIVPVRYSYNELTDAARELAEQVIAEGLPLYWYYVDEAANGIVMGTEEEKIPALQALAAEVFPDITVIAEASSPIILC